MDYKKGILLLIITSMLLLTSESKPIKVLADEKKQEKISSEKSKRVTSNKQLYGTWIDQLKEKIYKKARKSSKTVTREIIDLAFDAAENKVALNKNMKEHLKLVAIHLAVMEIESNFDNSIINHNPTTDDYGIMQVNSSVIKYCMKGIGDNTLNVFDLEDNIQMGSFEIYECYKKAKEEHPDNVIWWFYAYYNRGMFFEQYDWNYDDADHNSKIFIKKYNKYFRILYNE